jgi:predicted component of type VI protein secretion system
MLPVAMASGLVLSMLADLVVAQLARDLRLHDVVGARRAAAQMTLRHILDREPGRLEQRLRRGRDLLAVLHRTG